MTHIFLRKFPIFCLEYGLEVIDDPFINLQSLHKNIITNTRLGPKDSTSNCYHTWILATKSSNSNSIASSYISLVVD